MDAIFTAITDMLSSILYLEADRLWKEVEGNTYPWYLEEILFPQLMYREQLREDWYDDALDDDNDNNIFFTDPDYGWDEEFAGGHEDFDYWPTRPLRPLTTTPIDQDQDDDGEDIPF